MLGYWENDKATREAIDEQGYFHTGDIGEMDAQGRLKITDRKKEILVTSGGKNVAPQPLENALRGDKYIEQAVVIGDRRHFISAILVPNFAELRRWAQYKKLSFTTDAELVALPEARDKMMRRVQRINEHFSNYREHQEDHRPGPGTHLRQRPADPVPQDPPPGRGPGVRRAHRQALRGQLTRTIPRDRNRL